MTSDLCTEDVVVRITPPQIITSQTIMPASSTASSAASAGARVAASSAAVELGRRLLLAARAGDTQLVLDLMAKGAPFTTDWLGTSPLHLAASNAHAETCAVLLRAGVSRDARTKVERTPLHLAACAGHAGVARLLLDAGAAVDVRDMLRMTPLHWAVQRGHAAAARELLRHGADPDALSKFHKTPQSLAAELRRDDLLRIIDEAVKEREAARSVSALVNEEMAEATPTEPQIQTFDAVQRIQDVKPTKAKEKTIKTELNKNESPFGSTAAAALLRSHGITLLPTDDGSTVLNALQSGRTVVLSDAGKLMLKESETSPAAVGKASSGNPAKGMVLTATPVKSPPKPGVKIFTLNNKLGLAVPVDNKIPVKKVINPQDMQVKFVQLPPDAKIISPSKLIPMKAKNRVAPSVTSLGAARPPATSLGVARPTVTSLGAARLPVTSLGASRPPVTSVGTARPAVKIIMNKSNFSRLLAGASRTEMAAITEPETSIATEDGVQVSDDPDSPGALRAQLAAAQRALVAVRKELTSTRARLAQYERLQSL